MKWSFATVGIILLGLIGVAIIILFQNITTNNENDYYLLKEVTEAAMIDAIDISYYRETGDLKIITERFVENFTRRFAESTIFVTSEYTIDFYDIIETPPKVSIIVNTGLGEYTINGNADEYGISNKLDAILEYTGANTYVSVIDPVYDNPYVSSTKVKEYYAILSVGGDDNLSLKIPDDLVAPNIKDVEIERVDNISVVTTQEELNQALLRNELTYNSVTTDYLQSINDFATTISSVSYSFYNCESETGVYKSTYNCNNNDFYVSINGDFSNKVILKYDITWSYKEYEFSD